MITMKTKGVDCKEEPPRGGEGRVGRQGPDGLDKPLQRLRGALLEGQPRPGDRVGGRGAGAAAGDGGHGGRQPCRGEVGVGVTKTARGGRVRVFLHMMGILVSSFESYFGVVFLFCLLLTMQNASDSHKEPVKGNPLQKGHCCRETHPTPT